VFEVIGHIYTVRETTLTAEAAAREADNKRAEADARISEANLKAAQAAQGTARAAAEAAAANERAGKVELSVATQRERAARAELALLELKQQSEHRHLTTESRGKLIRLLQSASKGVALLTCPLNNSEACDFMNEIGAALVEAGWKTARDIPRIFPTTPRGIELSIRRKDIPNRPVEALDDAFEEIGLTISNRAVFADLNQGVDVRILVGVNPNWPQ
jgi:hypothetical protein